MGTGGRGATDAIVQLQVLLDQPGAAVAMRRRRWQPLTGSAVPASSCWTSTGRPSPGEDRRPALYRKRTGPLDGQSMKSGLWVAGLASLPLLNLRNADVDWQAHGDGSAGLAHLASLERLEVHQP